MNVLLLNQCFYPDVMATAQQLTDLAEGLAKEGHRVTVIASDRGYDDPTRRFPRPEVWNDIEIIRIRSLALGKNARWRRAVNFASFLLSCALKLLTQPRFDIVVASFRTDARATSVAAEVSALGLPMRRRVLDGWQQVLSGPFASRTDAETAQARLHRAGLTGTQIVPAAQ